MELKKDFGTGSVHLIHSLLGCEVQKNGNTCVGYSLFFMMFWTLRVV